MIWRKGVNELDQLPIWLHDVILEAHFRGILYR